MLRHLTPPSHYPLRLNWALCGWCAGKAALTLGGATVGAFSPSPGSYTSHGDLLLAELRLWDIALGSSQLAMCVGRTAACQVVCIFR